MFHKENWIGPYSWGMALRLGAGPFALVPGSHKFPAFSPGLQTWRWAPLLPTNSSLLSAPGALAASSISAPRWGVVTVHELALYYTLQSPQWNISYSFYTHTSVQPGQQSCWINKLFHVLYHVDLDDLPFFLPPLPTILPLHPTPRRYFLKIRGNNAFYFSTFRFVYK